MKFTVAGRPDTRRNMDSMDAALRRARLFGDLFPATARECGLLRKWPDANYSPTEQKVHRDETAAR